MNEFLQQLINGLAVGGIYALVALGYTMVYGVLKLINFAHGDIFTIGAYLGMTLLVSGGLSGSMTPVLAVGLVVIIVFGLVALLGVALGLGIFSAIIQVTMNWAQRSVSPTRATLIYTGEPVWAGIFGRLAGERLPLLALLGCVLILAGVLVSELKWKRKSPPQVSTNDDAQPLTDLADRREP